MAGVHDGDRDRLVAVLSKAPCHVLVADANGIVVESFDSLYEDLAGFETVVGRRLDEVFSSIPEIMKGVRTALETGRPWQGARMNVGEAGGNALRGRTVSFIVTPLHRDNGPGGIAIYADEADAAGGEE